MTICFSKSNICHPSQRCHEEREARLKILTSKNKSAMATATPVRTTKLAYVESVAKPLRGSKVWPGILCKIVNDFMCD